MGGLPPKSPMLMRSRVQGMSCASNKGTALMLRAPCLFLQELEAEEYGRKGINLTPDLWLVKLMVRVAEVCRAGVYVTCYVWGSCSQLTPAVQHTVTTRF